MSTSTVREQPDTTLTLSAIGRRAGVGRAAVANWRRVHADFPPAVGGTEESPQFEEADADAWLHAHGKVLSPEPLPPSARLDFGGGRVVTLHAPHLQDREGWRELGGYLDPEVTVPWPTATVRVELADVEPFAVARADVDLTSYGMPWRYLRLTWRASPTADHG
ncbi:hypothetical protein SAMN05428942_7262 [Streptomyces sp. 2112.2]|uniref:hypothetical protein n=1 Tax=Streptomyces sp. 2112.2 TaxID=1881024 RepID=UPI00089581BB|nr:hypothetical protein [Streptomyces sp. 2112.2]SEF16395.1 hypothetical protein SAMN05428942_7262 [Streptomyces sp. 2112.2]